MRARAYLVLWFVSVVSIKMSAAKRSKWLAMVNEKKDYPFKMMDMAAAFCQACEKAITVDMKSQLIQHLKSKLHGKNTTVKNKSSLIQLQLEDLHKDKNKLTKAEVMAKELCEVFLSCNIPWSKLDNPKMHQFLETYTGLSIPDESTLRKRHLSDCYTDVMVNIRHELEDSPVWISVDETTDTVGRCVANVLMGKLSNETFSRPYLVNCTFLEKPDSSSVSRLVNDTLHLLFPEFDANLAKMLVMDGAHYLLKCGRQLKVSHYFV